MLMNGELEAVRHCAEHEQFRVGGKADYTSEHIRRQNVESRRHGLPHDGLRKELNLVGDVSVEAFRREDGGHHAPWDLETRWSHSRHGRCWRGGRLGRRQHELRKLASEVVLFIGIVFGPGSMLGLGERHVGELGELARSLKRSASTLLRAHTGRAAGAGRVAGQELPEGGRGREALGHRLERRALAARGRPPAADARAVLGEPVLLLALGRAGVQGDHEL
jgi:hypothetical protein